METYDVVVVGGGPAGASAAYNLARGSLRVALLEKATLPRYKACGGVVASRVETIVDFALEPVIERKVSKLHVTVDLAAPFTSGAPKPWAYMVMRDRFDAFLVEQAASAGATIYQAMPLQTLRDAGDHYIVTTPSHQFRATYVVGADGAYSRVRKLLNAPPFQRVSVAIEREIKSSPAALEPWTETLAVDLARLRSGYAWVFPKATNFSVGVGGPLSVANQFRPYYARVMAHYGPALDTTVAYIAAGHHLPIRVPDEQLVYGRVVLVGDAAGLIEPMAGEGIYYAIRSGQLAAETILEAATLGPGHLARYQLRIDQEIQPELQASKACLAMLDRAPRFWVPRLLTQSSPFWRYFYRIFTGETTFRDLPGKFGLPGTWLFAVLANDDQALYRVPRKT